MNSWAITDKGLIRRQNQDAYFVYCDEEHQTALLLVCDGMGGAKAGNVASTLAADVFSSYVKQRLIQNKDEQDVEAVMKMAAQSANTAVFEKSVSDAMYAGMGTTLVAAYISGTNSSILNIGDSRAYLISKYGIRQITRDHSVVEDLIASGDLTREEAKQHPNKNLITRALGTSPNVVSDIFPIDVKEGEYLLLCSDGLTNLISDEELFQKVTTTEKLGDCCEQLLKLAMSRGAPDNVTLIVFKM